MADDSLNAKLANHAAEIIRRNGGELDRCAMSDFDCPSYDQDALDADGFPQGAAAFKSKLEASDAFVITSPEYNFSVPGMLMNSIDWVSRYRPQPSNERHGLLMSASPSMAGGNRGLWALRVPLEHLGARVAAKHHPCAKKAWIEFLGEHPTVATDHAGVRRD